jgi:hypothetical protein
MSTKTNNVKDILANTDMGLLAGRDDTRDITEELADLEARDRAAQALEQHLAEKAKADPTEAASQKLAAFELSPKAKDLLDKAVENAMRNTGSGIEDDSARLKIKHMSELLAATDGDLSTALVAVAESMDALEVPNAIFSLCFGVQKAAIFIGNLQYRRALDPKDGEGTPVHDYRDHRDPPYGLGPDGEDEDPVQVTLHAIEEVHLYLQLVTESFGWDPERPMPFVYLAEKDGTFKPLHDVEQALDYLEIRRKQAQAKRQVKQAAGFAAAAARAKAALLAAGAKTK